MTDMTLRDANLLYAALKLYGDELKAWLDQAKDGHLAALQASVEDTGAKSWTVAAGGEKVATITLAQRKAGYKVADETALADALAEAHPDMVETVTVIKPWAVKQLLDSLVAVTEDGGVTRDGEVLPGIVETPPGDPYQSVRWEKAGGKDRMIDAIRSGELRALLEQAGVPALGS